MGLSATEQFSIGLLVRVWERYWVVLPSDDPEILKLRPVNGSEAEACGLFKALESSDIRQTEFAEPTQRAPQTSLPVRSSEMRLSPALGEVSDHFGRSGGSQFDHCLISLCRSSWPFALTPCGCSLRMTWA